jgi:hypothetical protein
MYLPTRLGPEQQGSDSISDDPHGRPWCHPDTFIAC